MLLQSRLTVLSKVWAMLEPERALELGLELALELELYQKAQMAWMPTLVLHRHLTPPCNRTSQVHQALAALRLAAHGKPALLATRLPHPSPVRLGSVSITLVTAPPVGAATASATSAIILQHADGNIITTRIATIAVIIASITTTKPAPPIVT